MIPHIKRDAPVLPTGNLVSVLVFPLLREVIAFVKLNLREYSKGDSDFFKHFQDTELCQHMPLQINNAYHGV